MSPSLKDVAAWAAFFGALEGTPKVIVSDADTLEHAIRTEDIEGEHRPLGLAVKWLDTYGQLARAQIPTRQPNGLNSTGPVEQVLREIDRRIATASAPSPTAAGWPSC